MRSPRSGSASARRGPPTRRPPTGLTGSAYDTAERGAWEVLQLMLTDISTQRTELLAAPGHRALPRG